MRRVRRANEVREGKGREEGRKEGREGGRKEGRKEGRTKESHETIHGN